MYKLILALTFFMSSCQDKQQEAAELFPVAMVDEDDDDLDLDQAIHDKSQEIEYEPEF